MFRRGHELGSRKPNWSYPSAQWLAEAERLAALAERLLAILKGEAQPMDNEERLAMAQMLYDTKRFAFSTRFSAEAFAVDPNSGDDLGKGYRYKGACSAILASSGNGTDNPKPDEEARAKLRRQGLDWLKADLALRLAAIGSGKPEEAIDAREKLQIWKDDSDLASVRDPEPLAKLPEAERKQWQALWAEVDALIAGSSKP
jgi:hypothetical protein